MNDTIDKRYVIARECTAHGDTFTVVEVTRIDISNHLTLAGARAALARYDAADARRKSAQHEREIP